MPLRRPTMESSSTVLPSTNETISTSGSGYQRSFEIHTSLGPSSPNGHRRSEILRPASSTNFALLQDPNEFSFTFSEEDLVPSDTSWLSVGPEEPELDTPEDEISNILWKRPGIIPGDSKITVSRTLLVTEQPDARQGHDYGLSSLPYGSNSQRVPSESTPFNNFSRNIRVSPPASISSERRQARNLARSPGNLANQESHTMNVLGERSVNHIQEKPSIAWGATDSLGTLSRKDSFLGRKSRNSISSFLKFAEPSLSARPSSPIKRPSTPPQRSFSSSTLPSFATGIRVGASAAPLPSLISADKFRVAHPSAATKKDELWSVFRTLDGDFQKYATMRHNPWPVRKAHIISADSSPRPLP